MSCFGLLYKVAGLFFGWNPIFVGNKQILEEKMAVYENEGYKFYVNFKPEYVFSQFTNVFGTKESSDTKTASYERGTVKKDVVCSAAALASCLSVYYDTKTTPDDIIDKYWEFNENRTGQLGCWIRADSGNSLLFKKENAAEAYSEKMFGAIKKYLKYKIPVIMCTKLNGSTHYVTVVGVMKNVKSLDSKDFSLSDLVVIDPGTGTKNNVRQFTENYNGVSYEPFYYTGQSGRTGNRLIVPYLTDDNKEYITAPPTSSIEAYEKYLKDHT
jgi:hypothetical protein